MIQVLSLRLINGIDSIDEEDLKRLIDQQDVLIDLDEQVELWLCNEVQESVKDSDNIEY